MSRFFDRPLFRFALIGLAAASLGLTACGRKGPLDPPPSAAISPAPDQPSLGDSSDPNMTGYRRAPSATAAAPPTQPPPPDWDGVYVALTKSG